MLQTAPKTISEFVLKFCSEITSVFPPVYLQIESFSGAIPDECYENVEKYIKQYGGSIQYGWQIWEWPNVMIEAEFHAVWVSASGEYKEVTPKASGIDKVLFLPDPTRKYRGKQINNIRKALKEKQSIKDFIDSSNKLFELLNRGELADQYGLITMTPEMKVVQTALQKAFLKILEEENIKIVDAK